MAMARCRTMAPLLAAKVLEMAIAIRGSGSRIVTGLPVIRESRTPVMPLPPPS